MNPGPAAAAVVDAPAGDGLPPDAPAVALLPWGDVFEDYLDAIGTSFEQFAAEASGGWLFGYVEALRGAGVRTVIVCVSRSAVGTPGGVVRHTHAATGAPIYALAPPPVFRAARRFGPAAPVAAYLATPLRALAGVLRRERCGALLCQEYEYARFDACVLLGRLLGLPVFATFQGGDGHGATRTEQRIRRRTLRAAAGLCIASASERERVRSRYGIAEGRVAAIPNPLADADSAGGAVSPEERGAARRALGLPEDAHVAVWHGRVERHRKGMDVLLGAWRGLCAGHPRPDSLRLLLLGTGIDADWLRGEIAALSAPERERVRWTDRYVQDRAEIRRHLAAGDVYLFPSRHEGFAVAPMEAMAAGLPVVASAMAPGVGDLLGPAEDAHGTTAGGGLLVPGDDPQGFASALLRLLDDDALRARLGEKARRRIKDGYAPEAVGAALRAWLFPAAAPAAGALPSYAPAAPAAEARPL